MKPLKPKYGQVISYILLLAGVIAVMIMTRECGHAAPLPPVAHGNTSGDTIDVAVIYGPLSYYLYPDTVTQSDTIGGINYDLLNTFSQEIGRPVKMWPIVNLENTLKELEKGTYDIVASLPSDNSVKQRFLTSQSVFLDRMTLIQISDTTGEIDIKSALDLADDTVHIQADSPAGARLANLANEIGAPIEIVKEPNFSEEYLCIKVATGDFRYAVVNEQMAKVMKERYPRLNYDNPVSFTQFQVWLLNKNDSVLLNWINNWLYEFKETEAYRQIMEKY